MVACLVEKQRTTPDQYPLTLNSLRLACNQSTNRDPVVDYDEGTVRAALDRLGQRKWTTLASWSTARSVKYKHVFKQALDLTDPQLALLTVLMLRGPADRGGATPAQRADPPLRVRRGGRRDARRAGAAGARGRAAAAPGRARPALRAQARRGRGGGACKLACRARAGAGRGRAGAAVGRGRRPDRARGAARGRGGLPARATRRPARRARRLGDSAIGRDALSHFTANRSTLKAWSPRWPSGRLRRHLQSLH